MNALQIAQNLDVKMVLTAEEIDTAVTTLRAQHALIDSQAEEIAKLNTTLCQQQALIQEMMAFIESAMFPRSSDIAKREYILNKLEEFNND